MQQIDRSYYGSRLCCWRCVEIITGKGMTPHKISRMFHHGRFHTISVDNGPTFYGFLFITVIFIQDKSFYDA